MVLRTLCAWRQSAKGALLVSVVRTWGSSPRPVGSIMALCEDGSVVGSVSGGCIEDDLIDRFTNGSDATLIQEKAPHFLKYGVTADEAHLFGLPCGGTLELLLEYNPDADSLSELVARLEQGQLVKRTVHLRDGQVCLDAPGVPGAVLCDSVVMSNTFGPEYRMLIIGAGQLSVYLATMALFSGFSVTICDPRVGYANSWSVPDTTLLSTMPDDAVVAFKPDNRTCVLALTHDPKLDDLALLEALDTNAFYVGAIGSRRNNEARRARMVEHLEQSPETVAQLRGPVGVYIGSKTPPEIAISVMAEVIAVKNGVQLPRSADVAYAKNSQL